MAKKNDTARSWWTERWISVLESLDWSGRLQRGRTYARGGRVRHLDVEPGVVRARVQGSRPSAYRCEIGVAMLPDDDWERALDVLGAQAFFAAKLLAGELPPETEQALAETGVALFPTQRRDIHTFCNCPDWANPCKHIAALFYVLGTEFDRDPFLILRLRGRTKEQIISSLRERRATPSVAEPGSEPSIFAEPQSEESALEGQLSTFWQPGAAFAAFKAEAVPPSVPGALLKRLGRPSFWLGGDALTAVLTDVYRLATEKALELAYSEDDSPAESSLDV